MLTHHEIDQFISNYITKRPQSLLSNDLIQYHEAISQAVTNKNILVIGGAGTIGSWYIKALLKFNVAKLIVVDINENGLTELVRDLRSSLDYNIPEEFVTYPVNFSDPVFEKILQHHGPFQIVANFAAHKHVRSEKDIFSIEAMIENNVFRTHTLVQQIAQTPVEHFFCVSTDKATNPVNIMGASKKLMEELLLAYSNTLPVTTARFANVAFSNGSLPIGWLERLSKRQPWSAPLNVKRFFVSPKESGQLCLIASILGNPGDIFFPKLDPIRDLIPFDKIAFDLMYYIGLQPEVCYSEVEAKLKAQQLDPNSSTYPIYLFNTDTTGEKPYEEFFTENEKIDYSKFSALGVVQNTQPKSLDQIEKIIDELKKLFTRPTVSKKEIVETLKIYLPHFSHLETGKGLDSKM